MRTVLVVASIAVGIFAVGTVQQISTVVLGEMQAVYDISNASHATIFAAGIDDDMLESIRRMPEVAEAEGRGATSVKIEVAPGQWETLTVTSIADFQTMPIDTIKLVDTVDGMPNLAPKPAPGPTRMTWPSPFR